jgi:hypothetical protein
MNRKKENCKCQREEKKEYNHSDSTLAQAIKKSLAETAYFNSLEKSTLKQTSRFYLFFFGRTCLFESAFLESVSELQSAIPAAKKKGNFNAPLFFCSWLSRSVPSGLMVCCALFFVASDEKSRQKKKQIAPFFSVTPFALGGRFVFCFACSGHGLPTHKKKMLALRGRQFIFCGGRAWRPLCCLSALHPSGVPPRPHTRHWGAVAYARVGLRMSRLTRE